MDKPIFDLVETRMLTECQECPHRYYDEDGLDWCKDTEGEVECKFQLTGEQLNFETLEEDNE